MNLKKSIFMINKLRRDIFRKPTSFQIPDDIKSENLREYYFVFNEDIAGLNKLITSFDKNGIPINKSYIDVENPRNHYYPISIGQYGLAVFHSYIKTHSEDKKLYFLTIADWFYANVIEDEILGAYWLTDIPKPEYRVQDAWKSAFSQSRALSILLRAWQLTGDNKYFELCKKALIPFTFDIKDNGVSANLSDGFPIYEEYVASEPTMVLDGHNFSLFGLYDFVRAVPEKKDPEYHNLAKSLFEEGIKSLIHFLPKYDMGFWIRFNLCKMEHYPKIDPCSIGYIRLINRQLKILYEITKERIFLDYQKKIAGYDTFFNIIKMYLIKYKALKTLNRL